MARNQNPGRFALETSGAGEFEQLAVTLELWFVKLNDMAPAMQAAAKVYYDWIEMAFGGEYDPNTGSKWPELSQRSIKDRAKENIPHNKKLRRTNVLYDTVTGQFQKLYQEAGIGVTTYFLVIDTSDNSDDQQNYAYLNNYGGQNRQGKEIPPRPFMLNEVRLTAALFKSVHGYLAGTETESTAKFTALDKLYGQNITKYGSEGTYNVVASQNMAAHEAAVAAAASGPDYGIF